MSRTRAEAPDEAPVPGAGYPGLTRALVRNAVRQGETTALIDGERVLTWDEVHDRVARLAGAFRDLGVPVGGRVAILAQNSHQIAESVLAALWCGAIAYPLNHRLAVPELATQFAECAPSLLLVHADFIEIARALPLPAGARIVVFEAAPVAADLIDYEALIAGAAPIPDAGARDDDTALLVYTGGTTGRSKGVMLTHANLWANALNVNTALSITAADRYMLSSPLFHVSALARMFSTMVAGASLVFLRRFTAAATLDLIERHRVAVTTLVPTMLKAVVEHPDLARFDLSSLRIISYGAAPSAETLLQAAMQRLPQARLWQAYGMTEVAPTATQLSPDEHVAEGGRWLTSAGRPALLCEVDVVGPDDAPLPRGEIGEIVIRGPNVMKGYWHRPDLTRQTLRGGWMHTGDLGYLDAAGFLFVVDRKDDMIISGGENVYTTEVENAVSSHPGVGQCAVMGLADPTWGQVVHIVVVPAGAAEITLDDIQAHCRPLIAGYKLPRSLEIRREPLPLSGVNKVVKARLKAEAEARRATEQTR